MKAVIAAAALFLLAQTAAAVNKSAGNITVLGDSAEFNSAVIGATDGVSYSLDGALAAVAYSTPLYSGTVLESGFYSRMTQAPAGLGYGGTSTGSYALAWAASNPQGTTYQVQVSTWALADPYMAYYSTDQNGYPVESMPANTTFYNTVFADYMEGDYSAPASTLAVTLAVAPSSGPFTLQDAGHNTLGLSFTGYDNPPPVSGTPWTIDSSTLPAARYGQASVVYSSYVFVSGGFDGVEFSSAVYRSVISAGGLSTWEAAGYMPASRYGHQLVAAKGRLYLIGGYDAAGSHAEVWSADVSSSGAVGEWFPELPLPSALYFHAAAAAGGRIYVSGGYSSGSGVQQTVYSAQTGDDGTLGPWTGGPTLPAPRYSHSMTLIGGRLYVAGGKDGASVRSEVWGTQLDAQGGLTDSWHVYSPLPSPRYGHSALAAGNMLYVIGGNNGSFSQAQVFRSSVSADITMSAPWQAYNQLPEGRQFACAADVGGTLLLIDGANGSSPRGNVYSSSLNSTQYAVEADVDPAFPSPFSSGWQPDPYWAESGLQPGTTYYFRAKARNWQGQETAYSAVASTITFAAVPSSAPWTEVGSDSATAHWLTNGNPPGTIYEAVYTADPNFASGLFPVTTGLGSATFTALLPTTTYYAKVRVMDASGRSSRFVMLPPQRTGFNPALDISSPVITDAQADFADWKATNTFPCAVSFSDAGGSGLNKFQVEVATKPGGGGGVVAAWTDVVSNIGGNSYSGGWTIPQSVWQAMPEGTSNYISISVFDFAGNTSSATDVFSLLKDSTPPSIEVTYSTPAVWYADYPGDISGLRFDDALSGLAKVQYSASNNKQFGDAAVIPWTDIPGLTPGSTWYQPGPITYSFNQLANAASNYFSFRAVDVAGSTRTLVDAFGIGKNVSGPIVTISIPSALFPSTVTWLSGNTYPTNGHAVLGTQVCLRDLATGLYYDGSGFLAGSRVWLDADDQPSTFTLLVPGLPLASGRQYQAVARSSDSAGDYSQLYSTYTFTFDAQAPAAAVFYPADGTTAASAGSISGTASDAVSGITGVEVELRRLSDGKWWKNSVSSWTAVPEPLAAGTTPYWTWNFANYLRDSLTDGTSYYATVRASDGASPANSGPFYVSGSTFTYRDTTSPPATQSLSASQPKLAGAALLNWRASGDNALNGFLLNGEFKVAYSTYAGAQVSTDSAQVTLSTAALTAGSTQSLSVTGLAPSASYYFTLWTADDALNWSPPSNEACAMAGASDSGSLSGKVTDGSGSPVTGVLVEASGATGAVEGSDYTDVYGNYAVPGLNSAYLAVRAVWTAQDIESSVSVDHVPNGSSGVNFSLSVAYQLASVSGYIPSGFLVKTVKRAVGAVDYTTREVDTASSGAFVEIYRKGRRIGAAFADQNGAFSIPNLLPGTYSLRVFNGVSYSKMQTVTLKPGENLVFTPEYDLLAKADVYAYPNPARTAVNFRFVTSAAAFEAETEIFDIAGHMVGRLSAYSADAVAGGYRMTWDLKHDGVAPGVYLYILRIRAGSSEEKVIKKFAVIR